METQHRADENLEWAVFKESLKRYFYMYNMLWKYKAMVEIMTLIERIIYKWEMEPELYTGVMRWSCLIFQGKVVGGGIHCIIYSSLFYIS